MLFFSKSFCLTLFVSVFFFVFFFRLTFDVDESSEATSSTTTTGASGDVTTTGVGGGTPQTVVQKMSAMSREERRKALQASARARVKRVDKWGFQVDTMKAQRNQSSKERQKEAERAEKWAPMIAEWDKFKNKSQTRERFRKGLPDTLRGPLWRRVLNSDALRDANPGVYANLARRESDAFGSQVCLFTLVKFLF